MIPHRIQGTDNLVIACQCMLALVLFWYWFALGSAVFHWMGISVETVASYSLCIPVGLILESAIHNPTPIFGHKRQPNLIRAIPRPLRQTAIAIGFLFIVLILSRDRFLPRLFLFTFVPLLYAMLLCTGHFFPSLFCRKLFKGFRVERILLIGNPERAVKIRNWLAAEHEYGFRTAGILTDRPNAGSAWPTFLGTPDQLDAVITAHSITHLIVLQLPRAITEMADVLRTAVQRGVRLVILSDLDEQLNHTMFAFVSNGLTFFAMNDEPLESPVNRLLKRVSDLLIAVPAVLIVLPLAALCVKILHMMQSPGPLLYRQERCGIRSERFKILKFRTMAPKNAEPSRQATASDPRIFPAGRWLRHFSIDELPQFLNVLSGEMSVVGPRPHMVEHDHRFSALLANYRVRSFSKPGITGLAQVRGFRGETTTLTEISARLDSDLEYVENWSLTLDLIIIMRTLLLTIFPSPAAR
ncbi:MAG: hypothetical protein QOE88_1475 [Verrucomicrobiota bacterium]|nr:hypothetical protein [Verrucomicrobiota bacterium]